jgi:ribosomal protein S18 acetylase RimI-like enzyme
MSTIRYRTADAHDAAPIARIHAESWRRHYRGAYTDAYLDGNVYDERSAHWAEQLQSIQDHQFTIVAELDGRIAGFAHTRLDEDPRWGALLHNLHVSDELKRRGVGRALMAETARVLEQRRPVSGIYLWVLKQNIDAQAFYRAQGGVMVEEALVVRR